MANLSASFAIFALAIPFGAWAFTEETVFYDVPDPLIEEAIPTPTPDLVALPGYPNDLNRLTLAARVYIPDPNVSGAGPYPTVMILHGSGGLWSNDIIANGLLSSLEELGELLAGRGYLVIFPDSFNPRGIPGNFSGREPHWDPTIDDALCSPNYERPKDVIATLTYLKSRSDVDVQNIALIGYSHGAQSAMNAVEDPLQYHLLLDQATHSFDLVPLADPQDWNTINASVDQKAKRICREEVLKWLEFCLKPIPNPAMTHLGPELDDFELSMETSLSLRYQWQQSDDLDCWSNLESPFDGTGGPETQLADFGNGDRRFFRLIISVIPPPFDDPDNAGFFRTYDEFDLE